LEEKQQQESFLKAKLHTAARIGKSQDLQKALKLKPLQHWQQQGKGAKTKGRRAKTGSGEDKK